MNLRYFVQTVKSDTICSATYSRNNDFFSASLYEDTYLCDISLHGLTYQKSRTITQKEQKHKDQILKYS